MPFAFPRSFVVAAAAIGVALRLAFALFYWVDKPLTRDELEYLSLARSLASGHGYVYDEQIRSGPVEPFGRAPGYPVFLALSGGGRAAVSGVPTSVKVAQSLLGALGIVLIAVFAHRLAGASAARVAAALAAVYPPLVWICAYALSEALFFPVGLMLAWLVDWALARAGKSAYARGLVAGVVAGIAVLVRAATTPFLGLSVIWLLWKRRLDVLLPLVVGAAIVITPWAVRSTRHYGRFVLVATDGGVTFWTGNNALARGEGDMAANPELKQASQALKRAHPTLDEEQMEVVYYRDAFGWIRAHPLAWTALELRKIFYFIVPIGPSYRVHSGRYFWASVVSYGLILPAALVGIFRLRGRASGAQGLWLLAASSIAVCLIFFPQERFRIPNVDSMLIVCAAVAIAERREPV